METTNTTNSSAPDERRLCGKCQTFYGTSATNFMCSKCFKEDQEANQKSAPEAKPEPKTDGTSSGDVDMKVDGDGQAPEENKAEERPVQVSFSTINRYFTDLII